MVTRRFNQSSLLKKLNSRCERCHKSAREVDLDLHHRNGKSNDNSWQNIVIYCKNCHKIVEGRDKKKKDLR